MSLETFMLMDYISFILYTSIFFKDDDEIFCFLLRFEIFYKIQGPIISQEVSCNVKPSFTIFELPSKPGIGCIVNCFSDEGTSLQLVESEFN